MRIILLILVVIDVCTAQTLYAFLKEEALGNFTWQKQVFQSLHGQPDLQPGDRPVTQVIQRELTDLNVSFATNWRRKRATADHGFGLIAELGTGQSPCIGLRADIDALPITEQRTIKNKSKDKGTQRCGHDAHTAMLLGAIRILKSYENTIKGTIRFLFQPGEKGTGDEECLANEGTLAFDLAVDSMFAVHVKPSLPTGTIASRAGALLAGAQAFNIRIDGLSGRSSSPYLTKDPVPVAAVMIQAIQNIVSRELSPTQHEHAGVISITAVQSPQSYDVIPPYVLLKGTIRTLEVDRMAYLKKRLEAVSDSVATSFEQTATLVFLPIEYPPTLNDPKLFKWTSETLKPDFNITDTPPLMGSEDVSHYATPVPYNFLYLGTGGSSPPANVPLHSDRFVDEAVLPIGSALLAQLALTRIEALNVKPSVTERVKSEL